MLVRSRIPQTRTRESARESPSESKCQIWSTRSVLLPVALRQQTTHRRGPTLKLPLARGGLHLRREALVRLPKPVEAIRLRKEAGVQAGQIGRAERRRFADARPI